MNELIERLKDQRDRDAAEHCPAEIIALQDETIAAIEALQAENNRLNNLNQLAVSQSETLLKQRDALAAKVATLEADAERYRLLRERIYIDEERRLRIARVYLFLVEGKTLQERLDAAIDAAKGGQQ